MVWRHKRWLWRWDTIEHYDYIEEVTSFGSDFVSGVFELILLYTYNNLQVPEAITKGVELMLPL